MPFRFYRRQSLGSGNWIGLSKSGLSAGRRAGRFSPSIGSRGPRLGVRLAESYYIAGRKR